MSTFYNEIDPVAAQWLRNLIAAGHIAPGVVDERSIEDIKPEELYAFTQCHFFAGVGVWSYALRLAGWPDDRPIWTGSCPCQPFSAAGKGAGFADERHLWPAFYHLVAECRPAIVLGEQVASSAVDTWIDLVHADMEALGYAFGSVPFPSAGVGAPHIRDRNYWVANRDGQRLDGQQICVQQGRPQQAGVEAAGGGGVGGLADDELQQRQGSAAGGDVSGGRQQEPAATSGLRGYLRPGPTNGFWRDADWLGCRDGKWRPVEPRPQPLVDGSAESLGRVHPDAIEEIEKEINATTAQSEGGRSAAMRNLLIYLGAEAQRGWPAGRPPGLHEAPFLLSFMRQLQEQGWRIAEGVALPRPEATQAYLRVLRDNATSSGAPREHELEGQHSVERANAVHFLSSLLARHAHSAWDHAYSTYAEIGFPLAHGARSRVGRLRAYGNAINAEAARIWIETVMESM